MQLPTGNYNVKEPATLVVSRVAGSRKFRSNHCLSYRVFIIYHQPFSLKAREFSFSSIYSAFIRSTHRLIDKTQCNLSRNRRKVKGQSVRIVRRLVNFDARQWPSFHTKIFPYIMSLSPFLITSFRAEIVRGLISRRNDESSWSRNLSTLDNQTNKIRL